MARINLQNAVSKRLSVGIHKRSKLGGIDVRDPAVLGINVLHVLATP
jgi:hypothetical protein